MVETLDTETTELTDQGSSRAKEDNPRVMMAELILASVAGLVLLLVFLDGAFLVKQYQIPWRKYYNQRFDDPRIRVATHGLLASSMLNLQPWRVVLDYQDSTVFWLYADTSRALRETDMFARRITFDQGTFLQYAILGAERLGYQPRVDLFPNGEYSRLGDWAAIDSLPVARVQLNPAERQSPGLYLAMFEVLHPRVPFEDQAVPTRMAEFFNRQIHNPLFQLQLVEGEEDIALMREILQAAIETDLGLARIVNESNFFRTTEYMKNNLRDGITIDSFDYSWLGKFFWQVGHSVIPMRNQDAADKLAGALTQAVVSAPAYLVISSQHNGRIDQIEAGMLFARLQLVATAIGVAILPVTQAVRDYPEMFAPYVDLHTEFALRG
ncbi:MAG: hypothetical protein V3W14_05525, partial [Candidatus Neomarinimicrobiota bacterium]